jgi:UDP-glucuronate 4-epimerase
MRILVTGAAGFIGSHLCERLLARGDEVVGLDAFDGLLYERAVKESNLAGLRDRSGFTLIEGDLLDPAALTRAFAAGSGAVDSVVHLAALAGVRPSIEQPARYAAVNVSGTMNVVAAMRTVGCKRLVFASSSSVYGKHSRPPFREDDTCTQPLSPYAASKRAGELMLFTAHELDALDVTCLRFFTVYGPRQRPDLAIRKFTRLIAAGQAIPFFGDGTSSRDYTWIDDIIHGVVASIDQQAGGRGEAPRFRVYNLGGSRTTSLARLVELIGGALGQAPRLDRKPEQPGDMPHTWADVTLAGRDLGYAPRVSIDDGIPRFVAWWQRDGQGT